MQAGASQASNYRIGQDFDALRRYVEDGQHPKVAEVNLNADIVLELKPSDIRYKSLQNLFATTISEDLISGGVINSGSELHDHHIYPKNARKRYGEPQAVAAGSLGHAEPVARPLRSMQFRLSAFPDACSARASCLTV